MKHERVTLDSGKRGGENIRGENIRGPRIQVISAINYISGIKVLLNI